MTPKGSEQILPAVLPGSYSQFDYIFYRRNFNESEIEEGMKRLGGAIRELMAKS